MGFSLVCLLGAKAPAFSAIGCGPQKKKKKHASSSPAWPHVFMTSGTERPNLRYQQKLGLSVLSSEGEEVPWRSRRGKPWPSWGRRGQSFAINKKTRFAYTGILVYWYTGILSNEGEKGFRVKPEKKYLGEVDAVGLGHRAAGLGRACQPHLFCFRCIPRVLFRSIPYSKKAIHLFLSFSVQPGPRFDASRPRLFFFERKPMPRF